MNIAFIPLYIHILGVQAYGLVGAFAVLLTSAIIFDAGMTPTLNREMARFAAGEHDAKSIGDLFRSIELLCGGIILSICIGGALIADWLTQNWLGVNSIAPDVLRNAVILMIVTASLRVAEGVLRGALLGLQRHVALNAWVAFFATLRSGGAVLALIVSPSILTFFLWQAAVVLAGVVTFAIIIHRALPDPDVRPRFSMTSLIEVRRFAGGVLATSVLALLLTQADKMMLIKLLSLQSFAFYALAGAVTAGLYQIVSPVAQSYYPRLTELFSRCDDKGLAENYHRGAQIVSVAVAPPAAVMIFFAEPLLRLWTGDATIAAAAAPILRLLAIGSLLHAMMYMPYMLQLASGWSSFAVRVNAIAVIFLVPAILLVVPRYGAIGAASIWVVLTSCYVLGSAHFMHRRLLPSEKWRWYREDVGAPVGAAMVVAAAVFMSTPAQLDAPMTLAILALTGLAAFGAAAATLAFVREGIAKRLPTAARLPAP